MRIARLFTMVVLGLIGVVSWCSEALAQAPVPVIWDDFSDGKLTGRTGTDPWGRTLPTWSVSGSWSAATGEARSDSGTISVPCNVARGTWKFRYRYVNAPPTSDYSRGCYFTFIRDPNGSTLNLNNPTDGHWWVGYWATAEIGGSWPRVPHAYPYVNMVGSQIGGSQVAGTSWHEVVFIRDDKGYVGTWLDGTFVRWSLDINTDITGNTTFSLKANNLSGYTLALDNVEVYDGVFIIPNKGVSYASGLITINDYDVSLQRIADAVNNPSVFSYDPATTTATCNADMLIKSGAELEITGGTLKMVAGKKIKYEREAMIFLDGARIESTSSSPWYWEASGSTSYGAIVLSVVDSDVDNCGGFSADGMKCLYLKNSRFTNLVGTNPIYITFRRPTNAELLVKGCLFQGKTGSETLVFRGGDQFGKLIPKPVGMDFIDCEFNNITLHRRYDYPYYLSPGRPGGTANAVNTSLDGVSFNGTTMRYKYYLDVLVVDSMGRPVSGATVTVTNDQDDVKHPAENLQRQMAYLMVGDQVSVSGEDYFTGQQSNWFKGPVDVNDHRTTVTGAGGHTPLPSDEAGTLVITDRVDTSSTPGPEYTYTVTAEKDGVTGETIGVNPDSTWYRSDPGSPTKTVIVVLGGVVGDEVVGRWIFYNCSAFDGFAVIANTWDDDAIATDKAPLFPGQTASFANYTSYSLGINGIMVDIPDLPGTPSAADFEFKVGNDNDPDSWPAAPAPLAVVVRKGKGIGGSDRVSIVWNGNSIQKQWLQVTVKATAATGLAAPDVFYFGNAIGETGNSATDAKVTPTDQVGVRNNPHTLAQNPAGIEDAYDFNRDQKVGPTDELSARNNGTNASTALQLITLP